MFKDANAIELKEDFKNRFRNVSRLMDCVGCDKCRLWGKVQTQGYGTALKVLFEFDESKGVDENPPLRRTELVALVNTLDKLSTSLNAVGKFQQMWEARQAAQSTSASEAKITKGHDNGPAKPAEEDDTQDQQRHSHPHDTLTTTEVIKDEIELVWTAVKLILWSYVQFPSWW